MRTILILCGLLAGADAQVPKGGEAATRSACASRVYPPNPPNDGILFVDHAKNKRGGHLGHALVQYAPGKILAFYPNTTPGHSGMGWMEFKRSEDGGQTWSDPQELAFTKELFEKKTGRTAMAEKAVVTDKGEIVLFFLVCDVSQNELWRPYWVPLVSRSSDAGKTWSEPKPVTASRGRIYDAIYQDGEIRVLHFANDATNEEASHVWCGSKEEHVYELYVSTDGGETFAKRSVLPLETLGRGYGSLGQLGESDLIAFVWRHDRENVLEYFISQDGGKTWSKTGTSTVSRKIQNPQFIAFDGKYCLHGRSGQGTGGHMILYMSQDGVTWDDGVYLRMREEGHGAYSNSIVVDAPDGSGKQRLLIQASHAYNKSHATNVLHWWLESETANSSKGKGETLYNGIVLPEEWPPRDQDPASAEPMRVPYLEKPPTVIQIDTGRQLFVDDFLIESTDLTRTFHTAKKHEGNPVFKPETPAELKPAAVCYLGHGGVFYDPAERLVKMWYSAGELDGALAFATSRDGFTWERPDLGLPAGGNHLLPRGGRTPGTHAGGDNCLWLDTFTTNPAERLKFLVQRSMRDPHWLAVSADGRTWSDPVPAGRAGDYCSFFYNPFRNVWGYSVKRGGSRGRNRYYAESPVFLTEDAFKNAAYWCNADRLDEQDPEAKCPPQLYSLNAVAYESLLLGAFYIHLGPPNEVCKKDKFPKITEIKLGFSRDGFHWHRPDRRAFIPASRVEGSWDRAYVHSTAGVCLIDGDRLLFPYCAFSGIAPDGSRGMYHGGSVGMATLRRDGFASMAAGEAPGTLTTRPVTFSGKHLFVNVDAPEGSLRAEVLDVDGKPIAPFTMANSIPFSGDSTIKDLKWEGATDLSALAGQPVRFRFELNNGSLYAFWVSRDESGRSDGYLAAGDPGYTGPTDTVGRAALTKPIQAKDR